MNINIDWIPVTEKVPESFETECLLAIKHGTHLYFAVGRYNNNGGHHKWQCDDQSFDDRLYNSEAEYKVFMTEEELEEYMQHGQGKIVKAFGQDDREYYCVFVKHPKYEVIAWISLTELRKRVMNLTPYDLTRRNVFNAGAGNN